MTTILIITKRLYRKMATLGFSIISYLARVICPNPYNSTNSLGGRQLHDCNWCDLFL